MIPPHPEPTPDLYRWHRPGLDRSSRPYLWEIVATSTPAYWAAKAQIVRAWNTS